MRHIRLSEEDKKLLEELQKTSDNHVIRNRCLCLSFSNQGNSIVTVAKLVGLDKQTV